MRPTKSPIFVFCLLFILPFLTTGCTSLIIKPIFDPITLSLQQQRDLDLLRDGAPSLLLMIDGLINADPENQDLLVEGAKAYASYAAALDEFDEKERAVTISLKAKEYGLRLLQLIPDLEEINSLDVETLSQRLTRVGKSKIEPLFWGAFSWATWINMQNGAPAAMADLPKVERIMLRVIGLDDGFYHGAPHVFLGYYYGAIPAMYGGKPEASRKHFERALVISKRCFLAAQVAYAESYAKLQFDRELFEKLLTEVLKSPLDTVPDLTASNQMAKMRAKKLLARLDEFF